MDSCLLSCWYCCMYIILLMHIICAIIVQLRENVRSQKHQNWILIRNCRLWSAASLLLSRHLQGRPLIIKWEPLRISPASPSTNCMNFQLSPILLGSLHLTPALYCHYETTAPSLPSAWQKKRQVSAPAWGKWRKRQLPLSRRCGHHHPPFLRILGPLNCRLAYIGIVMWPWKFTGISH